MADPHPAQFKNRSTLLRIINKHFSFHSSGRNRHESEELLYAWFLALPLMDATAKNGPWWVKTPRLDLKNSCGTTATTILFEERLEA